MAEGVKSSQRLQNESWWLSQTTLSVDEAISIVNLCASASHLKTRHQMTLLRNANRQELSRPSRRSVT